MKLGNECLCLKYNFLRKVQILFIHSLFKTFVCLLITSVFQKNALCLHIIESRFIEKVPKFTSSLNENIAFVENKKLSKCSAQNGVGANTLKNFFNPTVVKATAIKKIKIFDVNSYYSIIFHIKRIFKYENRVVEMNHSSNSNNNYFKISSQEENSTKLNNHSIILVDFLNLKDNKECMNQVMIGVDYFLFLKSLNPSIKLEKRPHFVTNLNPKHFYPHKLSEFYNNSNKSNNELFSIKMPIFEAVSLPVLDEIDSKTEAHIQGLLCFMDAYCLLSKEQEKHLSKKELQKPAKVLNKTVAKLSFKSAKTKTSPPKGSNKLSKKVNTRDQYIKCQNTQNTCENNGECFITNENFYLFKSSLDKPIIKFCICQEFFEGPNCEFSVMNSILYDSSEIPSDFKEFWKEELMRS